MPLDANLFGMTVEDRSIELLRMYEPPEGYYLAFSGGKDSCVLLELAKRSGVKYDVHYNVTGIDPPELVRFIREHYPEVAFERPSRSFWDLLANSKVLPTRTCRWCCEAVKEHGGQGRIVLTGIRAAESSRRAKRGLVQACNRGKGRHFVNPILFWADDDVWSFIRAEGLAYCSLYDEGWKRIGCVPCPFASPKQTKRNLARWPRLFAAVRKCALAGWERRREAGADWIARFGDDFETYWQWWLQRDASYPGMSDEEPEPSLFGPD